MINLLATRTDLQNESLINYFKNTKINVVNFPFFKNEPILKNESIQYILDNIHRYQKLIFISSNAANCFKHIVKSHQIKLPPGVHFFCIGPTTKKELSFFNHSVHSPENIFDSQSLLKLEQLQNITQEPILIIRGEGGKELLRNELEKQGAKVDYLECYKRVFLPIDFDFIIKTTKSSSLYVMITSTEIARHFVESFNIYSAKHSQDLKLIKFIVNHNNIIDVLKPLGNDIFLTTSLNPESIKEILK